MGCQGLCFFRGQLSFSLTLVTKSGLLNDLVNGQNLQVKNCPPYAVFIFFSYSKSTFDYFKISPSSWVISPFSITFPSSNSSEHFNILFCSTWRNSLTRFSSPQQGNFLSLLHFPPVVRYSQQQTPYLKLPQIFLIIRRGRPRWWQTLQRLAQPICKK